MPKISIEDGYRVILVRAMFVFIYHNMFYNNDLLSKKWIYFFFVSVVQDLLKNNIVTPVTFDPLEVQVSLVLQSN